MSPLRNFPSTDSLHLLLSYKSSFVLVAFKDEPDISPIVIVLTPITTVLNKVSLTVLTSIRIFFSFTGPCSVYREAEKEENMISPW